MPRLKVFLPHYLYLNKMPSILTKGIRIQTPTKVTILREKPILQAVYSVIKYPFGNLNQPTLN